MLLISIVCVMIFTCSTGVKAMAFPWIDKTLCVQKFQTSHFHSQLTTIGTKRGQPLSGCFFIYFCLFVSLRTICISFY